MAVGKGETEMEIVKARTDKREYKRVVLRNCLQVLLCAASMNVSVGYFSDPVGLEGLAHFLEHMLFYASEKYPLEDSYSKYITEHGGSMNAFTTSDHTNFYFDVNSDCFEDALDRFAQFFIKPLMSADATMREIKAVDSENQKNLLSDAWRMSQVPFNALPHLWGRLCIPLDSSMVVLNSACYDPALYEGNWDTLEVRPKEKGLDTRLELIKLYEENYSANLMNLVIYAKESLDKIQCLVEDKFQEIRNKDRNCFSFPGQPCSSEHLQILVRSVPIKQGHKLNIVWPITPGILHYKEAPCRYLGHLIGHELEDAFR
ncbi:unnamed protein product [Dovyalis caffra]|uniref:Nardilysin n=1 Tax=Dovyalis caffra TaxID=77055 RepID=A0AAV1RZU4_9ROSI|nr:unnamed protein product [Dovyalis caffra]